MVRDESVKTISIAIPRELDHRAAAEARRRGVSKSELIRIALVALLTRIPEVAQDPWRSLAGFGSRGVSVEPAEADDVVYGR